MEWLAILDSLGGRVRWLVVYIGGADCFGLLGM